MKLNEYGIGFAVTGLMFFIASGLAVRFMPAPTALVFGAAVWALSAFIFVRSMKSKE